MNLVFTERRLSLFPKYCHGLDLERLIGPDITPNHLNELVIGRLLDQIYEYGPTQLFTDLVTQMFTVYHEHAKICHVDTTNFSVHGRYANNRGAGCIKITRGRPKYNQWDLLQFGRALVVKQHGVPILLGHLIEMNQIRGDHPNNHIIEAIICL